MRMMESHTVRLRAIVEGQVQGVGFRFFAQRRASSLGLRGYARNLPNGNVEVVAEGDRASLDQLLAALNRGPGAADVTAVNEHWESATGEFSGFRIRY